MNFNLWLSVLHPVGVLLGCVPTSVYECPLKSIVVTVDSNNVSYFKETETVICCTFRYYVFLLAYVVFIIRPISA